MGGITLKLRTLIVSIVVGIVALGIIGAVFWVRLLAPAEDEAIKLVPDNAAVYVNVFLDPSNSQKMAIRDLLKHFPAASDPEEAEAALARIFDRALAESGLTYEEDVEPWLGKQIAFFMIPPGPEQPGQVDSAALIATEDEDATREAFEDVRERQGDPESEEKTYRDVEYGVTEDDLAAGFVEDFLVVGTETAFRAAVDATRTRSLEDSSQYADATRRLPLDRLLLYYVDSQSFLPPNAAPQAGLGMLQSPLTFGSEGRAAGAVYARDDGVVIEASSDVPDAGPMAKVTRKNARDAGILAELPRDAWGAISLPNFGEMLGSLYEAIAAIGAPGFDAATIDQQFTAFTGLDLRQDVLSWMGDAGGFVIGTQEGQIGGGMIIDSKDADASISAFERMTAAFLARDSRLWTFEEGSSFTGFHTPDRLFYAVADEVNGGRAIVVYGHSAWTTSQGPDLLGQDRAFRAAAADLGEGFTPSGYIEVPQVVDLLENLGVLTGLDYEEDVKPSLARLSHVVFGAKLLGDHASQRLVIGVR